MFDQRLDDTQRGAAQRPRVGGAGRGQAHREQAAEAVEAIGQADDRTE